MGWEAIGNRDDGVRWGRADAEGVVHEMDGGGREGGSEMGTGGVHS